MTASQTFDPFGAVRFSDAGGFSSADPTFLPKVAGLVRYLVGDVLGTPAKAAEWLELLTAELPDREVVVSELGVISLRVVDDGWAVLVFRPVDSNIRVCKACGCTDDLGCNGGCRWVKPGLCSSCDAVLRLSPDGIRHLDHRA